jgi:hypothetical protein
MLYVMPVTVGLLFIGIIWGLDKLCEPHQEEEEEKED